MTLQERIDKLYDESLRNKEQKNYYGPTIQALSDLFTGNYKGDDDEELAIPFSPNAQEEILQAIESRVPRRLMRIFRDKYGHPWTTKGGNTVYFSSKRTAGKAYNLMRQVYDGFEHLNRAQKYLSDKDTISNIADAIGGQML